MVSQNSLINLLRDNITRKKELINEYYHYQDSSLSYKEELEKKLTREIWKIALVDFKRIEEIISNFDISDLEKENIINPLNDACKILEINYNEGTTLELDNTQLIAINSFINNLREYISSRKNYFLNHDYDIKKLEKLTDKYKKLVTSLKNPNNKEFISDYDVLKCLFNETKISEEAKQNILIMLIKYNKRIYDYRMGRGPLLEVDNYINLTEERISDLFKKFGYNFLDLNDQEKRWIIDNGYFEIADSVFKTLRDNNFPNIDLVTNGHVLTSLILGSNRSVIENSLALGNKYGLSASQLLQISSCLIEPQELNTDNKLKPYIVGRSTDFILNLDLFDRYGLSAKYVFNRCRELLTFPNHILVRNLEIFMQYDFKFNKRRNTLIDSSLVALMNPNFDVIVDQFMETHPAGFKYIKDNLCALRTYTDPFDSVFYSLYQASHSKDEVVAFRLIETGNINKICLMGNMSDNSDNYFGINDDNKREVTAAIIPHFNKKGEYISALENAQCVEIDNDIFDNPFILKLNEYSTIDPLLYYFDGIRISKLKVLRIFGTLINNGIVPDEDSLLFSVTYNSIINQEEFDKIALIIKEVVQ